MCLVDLIDMLVEVDYFFVILVDMSKLVYCIGFGDNDWYMWLVIGGGYVILCCNDSNEWYCEVLLLMLVQLLEGVKIWLVVNCIVVQVVDDQVCNGMSMYQCVLDGVILVNVNGWCDILWIYKVIQEVGFDNCSVLIELKVCMFIIILLVLDLDVVILGLQSNLVFFVMCVDLFNGLFVLFLLVVFVGLVVCSIELVFNNCLVSGNDVLVLDIDVFMNVDCVWVEDCIVVGVNGVGYQVIYDSVSKIIMLMLFKIVGGMFSVVEVISIFKSILLCNCFDLVIEFSLCIIEVCFVDEGGCCSYDVVCVIIQVEGGGLQVDFDVVKFGIQLMFM